MSGETYGDANRIRLNVGCPISKVKIAVDGIKRALEKM
jgi:cystathionine beta-lyase